MYLNLKISKPHLFYICLYKLDFLNKTINKIDNLLREICFIFAHFIQTTDFKIIFIILDIILFMYVLIKSFSFVDCKACYHT